MPDRERKPLSLFFHVDPRLAQYRDCFHFHVRLGDGGSEQEGGPERESDGRSGQSGRTPRGIEVSWCRPPEGDCPPQFVKDAGGGRGSICACGKLTLNGHDPTDVKGKIYPETGPIDASPPSGDPNVKTAALGTNIPSSLPAQPNCEDIALNFAFYGGNEIPNAQHASPSPITNRLVLWATEDGTTWFRTTKPFSGLTASVTECDATSGTTSITSGAGWPPLAIPEISAAKRYRITSQGPYPPAGTTLLMVRTDSEPRTVAEWKSCAKDNPGADWKLWVNSEGGRLFGTLVLHSLEGNRLAVPLVWKCLDWSEHGDNDFVFSAPPRSPHAGSVLTARPE